MKGSWSSKRIHDGGAGDRNQMAQETGKCKEVRIRDGQVHVIRCLLGVLLAPDHGMVVRGVPVMMKVASVAGSMVVVGSRGIDGDRDHGKRQADRASGTKGECAVEDQKACHQNSWPTVAHESMISMMRPRKKDRPREVWPGVRESGSGLRGFSARPSGVQDEWFDRPRLIGTRWAGPRGGQRRQGVQGPHHAGRAAPRSDVGLLGDHSFRMR